LGRIAFDGHGGLTGTASATFRGLLLGNPGEISRTVSAKGTLDIAENGTFPVDCDCSVRFGLTLPAEGGQVPEPPAMAMRGFLVDGGKAILAFQTDAGAMVTAQLTSDAQKVREQPPRAAGRP
jgi:hypothetical protein